MVLYCAKKEGRDVEKERKKGLVQWHYLRQTLCCFLLEKFKLISFQNLVADE
jgi:hypothetical protein